MGGRQCRYRYGNVGRRGAFQDPIYHGSAGPPSVHSTGSRHNPYHSAAYDTQGLDPLGPHGGYGHTVMSAMDTPMDMGEPTDLNFDPLEGGLHPLPPHPQQQQQQQMPGQVTAWYDTDL